MTTQVPYEGATSGARAREEITALLRRNGMECVDTEPAGEHTDQQ